MWKFWIDVGGTFTDCLAESPTGTRFQNKVLSSSRVKGTISRFQSAKVCLIAGKVPSEQRAAIEGEYNGLSIEFFDADGLGLATSVIQFSYEDRLELTTPVDDALWESIQRFEIVPNCHAPIVAMHKVTKTPFGKSLPDCQVKLGTTRGTNALLTRSGAPTALVTTKGFKDLLRIGDQARPDLFELTIRKPAPLFETSIEIDERILFDGFVEQVPDSKQVRKQLQRLRDEGIESVAICLLHGFRYSAHEQLVASVAREVGFADVRVSHEVAPLIKMVSRAETTVLDAYLNPVIGRYLDEIKQSLSRNSSLQLMTSSGGLVTREKFSGKDSVLSGPAGGVVGAARVGQSHGIEKVIGFDMGGTSTDVSRFDGKFERDYETIKAGVRIMTPMLAIETVAAGGGSICRFDGGKLVVGPESAGSDPGPACYGRGGPLTVTDLNLFVGRISISQFPFELNQSIVEQRLVELCDELAGQGFAYTPLELAEGFLKIANHNMAAAIRSVSVGKGYDPKEYVLVTFGGAGSQHACAIASLLNIEKVIDHPQSSILSAVGIGLAAPTAHSVRSVLQPLNEINEKQFREVLAEVSLQATQRLDAVSANDICVSIVLNLRYQGTETFLSIACADLRQAKELFLTEHQRQFGYQQDRPIVCVAVRAEATLKTDQLSRVAPVSSTQTVDANTSSKSQTFYFNGEAISAAMFDRDDLQNGNVVVGPAIIASSISTTVVDPNWQATVFEDGSLVLEPVSLSSVVESQFSRENKSQQSKTEVDPVQLEIFNQHFSSIASQMGLALQKTSVSVNVKERLDFSCAIFTQSGDLVVNAPHIPVHLGAMSETVRNIIRANSKIRPGDVFVTNNPYAGGSHLPDVTVVTPVFAKTKIAFWVASRSHHSEIGGKSPGSMPPDATTLGEEGVLIDNFRLIDSGVSKFDELNSVLTSGPYPSRSPDENIADIKAQVAANRAGETQLLKLAEQHGVNIVLANMKFIQDAAEAKARTALSQIEDGTYEFEDALDNDATIQVSIEKHQDELTIDFAGTDPVLSGNQNANSAIVASAVMYMMRLLIEDDIPLNEGVMKPVNIVLPECFLNPQVAEVPSESPAIVGGNVETSQRIVDVLLGALGIAGASQGTMNNWLMGDESFGYYETVGGGSGATAEGNGADAVHVHMTNTRLTDPEVLEARYPVILRECSIRTGSGGDGVHRGGDGMAREVEFKRRLTVSLLTNRRTKQPYAVGDAQPGAAGENLLKRKDSTDFVELESTCKLAVDPGDRLRLETPGGGGYGS